jgi:putative salt-induced outer membrane protein YdiY
MTTPTLLFVSLTLFGDQAPAPQPAKTQTPHVLALAGMQDEEAPAEEPPGWEGSLNVGLTEAQGNTEKTTASLSFDAKLEQEMHRYTLKARWYYEKDAGTITERVIKGSGQYDYLAGEKHYFFLTGGAGYDKEANIDLRYFLGGGLGYQFVDDEKAKFSAQAGVSYLVEEYGSGAGDSDELTLLVGYDFLYVFSEKTQFTQGLRAFPVIDDLDDVFLVLDSKLSTSLTDRMLGSIGHELEWDNTPAAGSKRDDNRIYVSLGWSFGG